MGLFNWQKINYTSPASAQGGPGIQKAITWYVGTPYIDMTAAQMATYGLRPGETWWLGGEQPASGGNCFQCVKANAALALGQLVTYATPVASTVGAAAPVPTTATFNWVAGGLTVNAEKDNWVFVTSAAATLPQLRRIKSNTASAIVVAETDYLRPNSPTDADVFDNVPVAGEVVNLFRPRDVIVCTASTVPVGVALGTVTSGNYTIIQKAGIAVLSVFGGGAGGTAVVAMQPVVPGAAGKVTGSAAAAANIYTAGSMMLPILANTADVAAPLLQPALVNFTGN